MVTGTATETELVCQQGYNKLTSTMRTLGFVTNDEKNVPPTQSITFLGGGLDTNTNNTGICSVFLDEEKRMRVHTGCTQMATHVKGSLRVSTIMTLMGLLMFCSHIVPGTKLYLRSGFDLIRNKVPRDYVHTNQRFRQDMQTVSNLYKVASPRFLLVKRTLTTTFGSWDASTSWGMGGFLDGKWFSEKWSTLLSTPQLPSFYPREGTATFHINYLELFAGYWFLKMWGESLRGLTIVCHTDNTVTESMLRRLWGTTTFIPLLKQIQLLMVEFDVALSPQRISTEDNTLSDCLSRGAMDEFHAELTRWSDHSITDKDMEDWQIDPVEVKDLDREYGPFDVDACTDVYRTNSHFAHSWNENDDCTKQQWGGQNVFCNGPFTLLLLILQHAVRCKQAQPKGTAALFIIPCWPTAEFYRFAMSLPQTFKVVRRWPTGTALFTATVPPQLGGGRRFNGPTRWPVVALRMGPGAECAP